MLDRIQEWMERLVVRMQDEAGQALAEYGLILGLIAVAAIIALGLLGTAISGKLGSLTTALNGSGSS